MSFFGSKVLKKRYGAIIDIGSGSVLAAIVCSNPASKHPQVLWSKREHIPLRNIDTLEKSAKAVMTSLINTAMELDSIGMKALREFDAKAEIKEIQCSISAPWSYTVTKTIHYTQEKPFEVNDSLIQELLLSIQHKIEEELSKNEALNDLGLEIITKDNLGISANGYQVAHPEGNEASTLTVSQATVVAQTYLIDSITQVQEKMLPKATVRKLSFVLLFHFINKQLLLRTQDTCLVDITYEATEIGIVRDGILSYCTHTPFGSFSLAREISAVTKMPLNESFGHIHAENPYLFLEKLPEKQKDDILAIFESYVVKMSDLFKETGDALSIPKHITLHTDIKTEPLFSDLLEKAAKRNLKTAPYIVPISQEIINTIYKAVTKDTALVIPTDTALLISAQFFHTHQNKDSFRYF